MAQLNAEVLLAELPTINLQVIMPDLKEGIEGLWDQLHDIDAFDEPRPGRPKVVFTEDLVERAMQGLSAMTVLSHMMSSTSGWWKPEDVANPLIVPTKIALMHSELTEAIEADRTDAMDDKLPHRKGIEVEFADLLHRVCDLAGFLGLDLGSAYIEKGYVNLERADHKPENRAKPGGKKY